MEPFTIIESKATPLPMMNIDTDQIVPKQFLKLIHRTGFGQYLFYDWRFDKDKNLKTSFVLNNPKYQNRKILLTLDNFGSGSSREHAVWALYDYGFRVIIAPSFADIFYNNCIKNGILPITLKKNEIDNLFQDDDITFIVDLFNQKITINNNNILYFEIDKSKKDILLEGLDEIGKTLKYTALIDEYEKLHKIGLDKLENN